MADAETAAPDAPQAPTPTSTFVKPPRTSADAPYVGLEPIRVVRDPAEAAALPAGSKFRDPTGQVRIVPHTVTDDVTYQTVPPGASYREGAEVKTKPAAAGNVSPQAMTLYDMAHTTEGRKKALEYVYGPGTVKEDRGELYVETPEGRLSTRMPSPGGLVSRGVGTVGSKALPAGGSAVGALAGAIPGVFGGGPVGAIAAGTAGGTAGAAAGEAGNEAILRHLGVESLSPWRAAWEIGGSGVEGGVGTLAGGGLMAAPSIIKKGLAEKLPAFLRYLGGVDTEALKVAKQIAGEGGRVPLSSYAPELPFVSVLANIAKQFGYDPVKKTAEKEWLPKVTGQLLESVGVPESERKVVGQTAAVPLGEAGEAAKAKAAKMLGDARTALEQRTTGYRTAREAALKGDLREAQRDLSTQQTALVTEADTLRKTAQGLINRDIEDLDRTATAALKTAGDRPGDLSRKFGERIVGLRAQMGKDAKRLYDAADEVAGDAQPDVAGVRQWAKEVLDNAPVALRAQYPNEIALLMKLGGETAPASGGLLDQFGNPVAATTNKPVTFGDLHQLRNFIRSKVDWGDLTRGPRQGALVKLDQTINDVIYDAEAVPELKEAASHLRAADDFYRDNIRKFEDATVRRIAAFSRAAAPADAEELASLAMRGGDAGINRERIRMIREMGGDNLWRATVAADTRAMLDAAGAQAGRVDPTKLAGEIAARAESGVLKEAYSTLDAERLRIQADRIMRSAGRVPMEQRPGDTVFTLMDRADAAIRHAQEMGARNPLATFKTEMAKLSDETRKALQAGEATLRKSPLNEFVSLESEAAANKIVETPSLLKSVAMEFGTSSPEFTMLRQAAARRYMQDLADRIAPAAGRPGGSVAPVAEKFFGLTAEAQDLLFPGVSREQMTNLMRKAVMMFPPSEADFGSSLAGRAMLFNPQRAVFVPKAGQAALGALPKWASRLMVGKMLSAVANIASSPKTVEFIARGLEGGPPGAEAAETLLRALLDPRSLEASAAAGATGAAFTAAGPMKKGFDDAASTPSGDPVPIPSWRDRASAGKVAPQRPAAGTIPSWRDRVQQRQ